MTRFIVVGAGAFGLSTAYHLLKDGEVDVVVLDKSTIIPAPDAASTDINRIVSRSAYGNPFYSSLALEATSLWKIDFTGLYNETGVMLLGDTGYCIAAQVNDMASGAIVVPLTDLPETSPLAHLRSQSGYLNKSSGWVDAEGGMKVLLTKVQQLGGKVLSGKTVATILFDPATNAATGVKLRDGEEHSADVVILATGSWTASSFSAQLPDLSQRLTATGQSAGFIQLSQEETERYKSVPVILNFGNNFYMFPPNRDGLLKFAIHDGGYVDFPAENTSVSTPRTVLSHGPAGAKIPKVMADKLRKGLREVYPELADRPFCRTRLCWCASSSHSALVPALNFLARKPDTDWIIDEHPKHPNLYIATGDSGHAFKFLPVLGRLVLHRIRGTLDSSAASLFTLGRTFKPPADLDRMDRKSEVLREEELIGPE
ncbi:hypothetical protein FRB90_012619 [Tulasnella sp. 427]|nr:hypothetical protein FRB90_012619 [Tulasnella sp. 427]